MGIYSVITCIVKPQKQDEFLKLVQKYKKYGEENPEKFEEMKSFKVFNQVTSSNTYLLIWEYISSEEFQNFYKRLSEDEEGNQIWEKMMLLTDYSNFNLWNAINITPIWEMNRKLEDS